MTETELTPDDLFKWLNAAKGNDPNAIQAITNFMDLKSDIERSYFPDKLTTIAIAQLHGLGQIYFKGESWNPFTLIAETISESFMGFKGFKSNQFVDMTRQTPNLDALKTTSEETKQGLVSRLLGRSKTE